MNSQKIKVGATYMHYKEKKYEVIAVAKHSETLEEFVVYKALYDDFGIWIRPLSMFLENIELNGKMIPRFELIN